MNPLVSIVCLCYNHRHFVRQAVESVIQQSYKPLQIIIADDASTDGSLTEIQNLKVEYPFLEILLSDKNRGNCKTFNTAFKQTRGAFVIDFSTDDVMMPDRIEKQVNFFSKQPSGVGVIFTDAIYINEVGKILRYHFEYLRRKRLIQQIPQGDIYRKVVSTYFIPSPTMMVRRRVLEDLGGYDENLSYEDFDFWVRSARTCHYAFLNEPLTLIRKVERSMSTGWYIPGDRQLHDTYIICKKIQGLNHDEKDRKALIKRVRYEFRQSVFSENYPEAHHFLSLLRELRGTKAIDYLWLVVNHFHIPLSHWRRWYHKLRFS